MPYDQEVSVGIIYNLRKIQIGLIESAFSWGNCHFKNISKLFIPLWVAGTGRQILIGTSSTGGTGERFAGNVLSQLS